MSGEHENPAARWSSELRYFLVAGEEVLGTLTVTEVDAPWVYSDWEPTAHFEPLRPLFDAEVALLDGVDDDAGLAAWEAAYDQIAALSLLLIPDRGGAPIEEFLLHIEGTQAWFRV